MRFMVCYDGKEASRQALLLAKSHARALGATLEIVQVITRDESLGHSRISRMESSLQSEIETVLGEDSPEFNTQLLLTGLEAGESIVYFAGIEKIDQIYLGVEKKSKVGKLVFGSTLQHVILMSTCPVVSINYYKDKSGGDR